MTPSIRPLHPDELAWANACYADIDFKPSTSADFLVLAEIGTNKAGLGRLVPIDDDCAELGGICVLPPYRGQHLAHAIVAYLLLRSHWRNLYCIPFAHLTDFYRCFDFSPVSKEHALPAAIAEKFDWCRQHYASDVALLVRTPPLSAPADAR